MVQEIGYQRGVGWCITIDRSEGLHKVRDPRTSTQTQANEYTSLAHVGRPEWNSGGNWSGSMSSGESHRTFPPLVEP